MNVLCLDYLTHHLIFVICFWKLNLSPEKSNSNFCTDHRFNLRGWAKSSQVHLLFNECIVHRKLWFVFTGTLCTGSKRRLCSPSIIRYSQFDRCGWWWSRESEIILHNIVQKYFSGCKAFLENVFWFWMDWLHIHGRKRASTWKVERDTKCHPIVCVLSLAFRRE